MHGMRLEYDEIHPQKVTLIARSLENDATAVLSARELEILAVRLPLTDQELRRLKSAIFAEAIRFTVWSRAKRDAERRGQETWDAARQTSYSIGRLAFDLLMGLQGEEAGHAIEVMLEKLRDSVAAPAMSVSGREESMQSVDEQEATVSAALSLARDRYAQGSLWLEVARDFPDRVQRRALGAQAAALLTHSEAITDDAADIAQGSEQQHDLKEWIERALADARGLW